MTDPLSAYIHRSWLVDSGGGLSEGVNKVAIYYWDTSGLSWVKATGGAVPGANVNVTNFPANYTVLQGTVPWSDNISQWGGAATSQGQKTMAASIPVSIASDQPDHYGVQQYLAPNGEVVAVPLYKLIGDVFTGASIDPNFWTTNLGTGGSANIASGQLTVSTGTTANNAVELTSVRTARFSGLAPNKLRIVVQLPDTGVANNVRHWGMWTATAGATFEMNGTTFQLVTRKDGVDSAIASGSFNGQYGTTFAPGTASHFYEIIYQPRQVVWLADNRIIHTLSASATPWSNDLNLPIHIGNVNSGGSTTNVSFSLRIATIARFGIPQIQPTKKYIHGAGTFLLKNTPGNLHSIVINSNTGTTIAVYDALSAVAGTEIALVNPNQITTLNYSQLPFSTGLTVVTTGATIDCTIVYE